MGERNIVIAGGGLTSLCVLDGILNNLPRSRPSVRLIWATGGSAPGRGDPYQGTVPCRGEPTLNQPAYAMSPFARLPEDYANWLAQSTRIANPRHAITPRRVYGDYCETVAQRLLRTALEIPFLKIDVVATTVTGINPNGGNTYRVQLRDGQAVTADHIAVATGHTRSTALNHVCGRRGFLSPSDSAGLKTAAEESDRYTRIAFYGCGASMLDSIQQLEAYGYCGTYQAIGRSWTLWAVEPEKYDPLNRKQISCHIFSRGQLAQATSQLRAGKDVHSVLQELHAQDLKREPRLGFQHVIDAFRGSDIIDSLHSSGHHRAAQRAAAYSDHVTSPKALELVDRLKAEKRFEFCQGSIAEVTHTGSVFHIHLEDGRRLTAPFLLNAAPYVKGAGTPRNGHSPLIGQMIRDHVIEIDDAAIVKTGNGFEARPGLAFVGPLSHLGRNWGAESFRSNAYMAGAAMGESLHEYARDLLQTGQSVLPLSKTFTQPPLGALHV